jgi:5'-3' exonuclease
MSKKSIKSIIGAPVELSLRNVARQIGTKTDKMPVILLDARSVLYRFVLGSLNAEKFIADKNKKPIMEAYFMVAVAIRFIRIGVIPVFVFDGRAPAMKGGTLAKRTANKENASNVLHDITDGSIGDNGGGDVLTDKDYLKYLKRAYTLNHEIIDQGKQILKSMGVPVVDSPDEADSQLAVISAHYANRVIGIVSDDNDSLLYGGINILHMKNLASNAIDAYTHGGALDSLTSQFYKIINTSNHTEKLNEMYKTGVRVSHDVFVDIACLIGTDYCSGIRPNQDCKSSFSNVDLILETYLLNSLSFVATLDTMLKTTGMSLAHVERIKKARTVFSDSNVTHPKTISIDMTEPDINKIQTQCLTFLSADDTDAMIDDLLVFYRKQQRTLRTFTREEMFKSGSKRSYDNTNTRHINKFSNMPQHNTDTTRQTKSRTPSLWPDVKYYVPITRTALANDY